MARFDPALGSLVLVEEIIVEEIIVDDSAETRVLAVDIGDGVPAIGGAFAVDALDDDAFVARLVP